MLKQRIPYSVCVCGQTCASPGRSHVRVGQSGPLTPVCLSWHTSSFLYTDKRSIERREHMRINEEKRTYHITTCTFFPQTQVHEKCCGILQGVITQTVWVMELVHQPANPVVFYHGRLLAPPTEAWRHMELHTIFILFVIQGGVTLFLKNSHNVLHRKTIYLRLSFCIATRTFSLARESLSSVWSVSDRSFRRMGICER